MRKLISKDKNKKLIVFDLDGTLAESKSAIDREMGRLLRQLLQKKMVAVISGGKLAQFQKQIIARLNASPTLLKNLFLFPTISMAFYRYRGKKLVKVYAHEFTKSEKEKIFRAFDAAFKKTKYVHPKKVYGTIIEDRGTQITFSALGQNIVDVLGMKGVHLKEKWAKTDPRPQIMEAMKPYLKGFEVASGGLTSIDVTRKGIDKAYGVRQIKQHLRVPIRDMLFVGDRIFPGGNDYPALKTSVEYVQVAGPIETKKLIRFLIRS